MSKTISLMALGALCLGAFDAAVAAPPTSKSPFRAETENGPNAYEVELSVTPEAQHEMIKRGEMVFVSALYSSVPKAPQKLGMEDLGQHYTRDCQGRGVASQPDSSHGLFGSLKNETRENYGRES